MRVVVTGMGILCAAGRGVAAFRTALLEGRPGDSPADDFPSPEHQTPMGARIPGEDAVRPDESWDPAIRIARVAIDEALADAGLTEALPKDAALILGTSLGNALAAQRFHEAELAGGEGVPRDAGQAPVHATADRVARELDLRGPRTTISNACVSGTNALGLALDMLRGGEAPVVIAGGVDTLHRFNFCGFANLIALTNDRCRPFDTRRTGMLLGEASAFLVLEPEDRARKRGARIRAEVAGYGAAGDAVHITAPCREGGGAFRSMHMALSDAGLTSEEVDAVSLHGTGTPYADGMEAAAMGRVFGERAAQVPAFSLRPITGHTMGSAGAVDTIACILGIEEGFVPPTLHHTELDPALAAPLNVVTEPLRAPVRVALNTSSGFAGSNASVVLRAPRDEGAA